MHIGVGGVPQFIICDDVLQSLNACCIVLPLHEKLDVFKSASSVLCGMSAFLNSSDSPVSSFPKRKSIANIIPMTTSTMTMTSPMISVCDFLSIRSHLEEGE